MGPCRPGVGCHSSCLLTSVVPAPAWVERTAVFESGPGAAPNTNMRRVTPGSQQLSKPLKPAHRIHTSPTACSHSQPLLNTLWRELYTLKSRLFYHSIRCCVIVHHGEEEKECPSFCSSVIIGTSIVFQYLNLTKILDRPTLDYFNVGSNLIVTVTQL